MINVDIKNLAAAKRYARALANTARENIDEIEKDLASINEILFNNESFRTFFTHPNISLKNKKETFKEAFEGKINPISYNFFQTILDEGRISIFQTIFELFKKEVNLIKNRCEIEVISAIELDEAQKTNIQNKLNEKFQKEALINYSKDEAIIGGLIVKFDDRVIDLSLKTKFETLRKQII